MEEKKEPAEPSTIRWEGHFDVDTRFYTEQAINDALRAVITRTGVFMRRKTDARTRG